MTEPEADDAVMVLFEQVAAARSVVAFTGAGISTECGVPDFRSPGSPWMRNKPIPFDAFVAKVCVWLFILERHTRVADQHFFL